MKTDIVEGELSINLNGLSVFIKAKYQIASMWDGDKLTSATATLIDWKYNGVWRPRFDLVVALGWAEGWKQIEKIEKEFAKRWVETVETGDGR